MADIIVQNAIDSVKTAIQESAQKFNYAGTLGQPLEAYLETLIRANITGGPYNNLIAPATGFLCDLTDMSKISSCLCNYSGSGTNSTAVSNTNNSWTNGTVLKGVSDLSVAQVSDRFFALAPVLANISSLVTGMRLDVYMAYLKLKSTFTLENAASILLNWYGVGLGAADGKALSFTNRIKVCGTDWKIGQGGSCTWTVPAGATCAKFQVWGAGQGSNPGCCCGGASFGENGAYAEMVIKVTPGNQYSICAGCSCSRYCCSSEPPGYGCMSGVSGTGICCLKADGAHCYQSNCDDYNGVRLTIGAGAICRRFQSIYCTSSGACWCGNGEYCYNNSCETCGVVPVYPGTCGYTVACSCATDLAVVKHGPQMSMCSMHGGGCLDQGNYGYHIRPPIINSDTGAEFTDGCRCQFFTSGTSCGGCNGKDWTTHPGHGGAGTHIMGGDNTHKGDTGRGGMVQVSWI
jgi:hypothetical protein